MKLCERACHWHRISNHLAVILNLIMQHPNSSAALHGWMWTFAPAGLHQGKLHQTPLWAEDASRLEHQWAISPVPNPGPPALSPLTSDNVLEWEIRKTDKKKTKKKIKSYNKGGPVHAQIYTWINYFLSFNGHHVPIFVPAWSRVQTASPRVIYQSKQSTPGFREQLVF